MRALVYFGRGRIELVENRPIVCTSHDVVARVDFVHRCGTDVKMFRQGRPDQLDDSLLAQLGELLGVEGEYDSRHLESYVSLLRGDGPTPAPPDPLHAAVAARLAEMGTEEKGMLWPVLRRIWGRILGHEMVVTVERVGSEVHTLREGIGYLSGHTLSADALRFEPGRRYVVQTRIAQYWPPRVGDGRSDATRGIQLLGRNITDLAMEMNAGYAQAVRLTPEIVQSGSVIPVPDGLSDAEAAMVEPAACLLDCFEKTAHEIGQDDGGSILKKGVMPGGVTAIIGSGSMAILAGRYATMSDERIDVGRAGEAVFFVRSREKADLVRAREPADCVSFVIGAKGASHETILRDLREQFGEAYRRRNGGSFEGFDDVIVCAGGPETIVLAHKMLIHTGGRIMAFAGTRGPIEIESGAWHYGNAGIVGTSGCNTKMMEIVLQLLHRGSLSLGGLTGRTYSLDDVGADPEQFFGDTHLRPALAPNEGIPSIQWDSE